MILIDQYQYGRLLFNNDSDSVEDHLPVVKLVAPTKGFTWLISELDFLGIAFGIYDLGNGYPEIGHFSFADIVENLIPSGLHVEPDRLFKPKHSIGIYAEAASYFGKIIEDEKILSEFAN